MGQRKNRTTPEHRQLHRQVEKNRGRIGLSEKRIPSDPSNLFDGDGTPHENLPSAQDRGQSNGRSEISDFTEAAGAAQILPAKPDKKVTKRSYHNRFLDRNEGIHNIQYQIGLYERPE